MEWNKDSRNRTTQIRSNDVFSKVQRQFNGVKITFSMMVLEQMIMHIPKNEHRLIPHTLNKS